MFYLDTIMLRCWFSLYLACFLFFGIEINAKATPYVVDIKAVSPSRQDDYYVNLLRLILNASKAEDEVIEFRFSDRQFTQWRWLVELTNDNDNGVLWTATSQQRETLLRPIRVPLFKGLIGARLLVIRREDAGKFANVNSLLDLQQYIAGQGANWPDTTILRANGLRATEGVGKEQLYKMLGARRFDYFPRGVTEIANEQAFLKQFDLIVEPHLLLSYPAAIYFFVNKNNDELARRIERGWDIILANSEFDHFFYNHSRVSGGLQHLDSHKQVIRLANPERPDIFPFERTEYWYQLPISDY